MVFILIVPFKKGGVLMFKKLETYVFIFLGACLGWITKEDAVVLSMLVFLATLFVLTAILLKVSSCSNVTFIKICKKVFLLSLPFTIGFVSGILIYLLFYGVIAI